MEGDNKLLNHDPVHELVDTDEDNNGDGEEHAHENVNTDQGVTGDTEEIHGYTIEEDEPTPNDDDDIEILTAEEVTSDDHTTINIDGEPTIDNPDTQVELDVNPRNILPEGTRRGNVPRNRQ